MSERDAMTGGHRLLKAFVAPGSRRFHRNLDQLERVQRGKLQGLLRRVSAGEASRERGIRRDWTWEEYSRRLPVTDYDSWRADINRQRRDGGARLTSSPVRRYQPTSGSSSAVKWVPYTRDFLGELDAAISPWIADLYRQWPGMGGGRHYWSMSWMPTSLRREMGPDLNDDMKLMAPAKRWLAGRTQAVPQQVSLAETSDDSLFATLAWLAAHHDLTLMSVWSPTFGLGLLEGLSRWREELATVLREGRWGARAASMGQLACPFSRRAAEKLEQWNGSMRPDFFHELWPRLTLVSAWDTAASRPWADKLGQLLPRADFQGKGLWATEGVVTIPLAGRHVLAYQSHVYEFEDVQDGRILPPWMLRRGQDVMPVLSTGSGLLRYRMNDVVHVEDFAGQVPCLRFLGRNDGTDMVGEKLSVALIQETLDELDYRGLVRPLSLVGFDDAGDGKPGYVLLLEPEDQRTPEGLRPQLQATGEALENRLLRHFHYRLARDLGQLAPVRCLCHPRMHALYLDECRKRGMIEGNIKVEALRYWDGTIPGAFRDAVEAAPRTNTELLAEVP